MPLSLQNFHCNFHAQHALFMQIKNFLFLFIAVCLFAPDSRAQYNPYWQWAKADSNNTSPVSSTGSVLAVKNGKALWGHMTAVKRFTPDGEAQGNWDVTEYDSNGKQLNKTLIQGKVQLLDAQVDAAGNWYVLGRYYDTLLFSGGIRYVRNNPATNIDADHFMVKFMTGSMAIAWVTHIGPFRTVSARSFTVDANRILVAADSLDNTVIRSMAFSNGAATTLIRQTGGSTSTSIQTDAQGNIYLAGTCAQLGIDFNGVSEPATAPESYSYLVKYRSNGSHGWHLWMRDLQCNRAKITLYQNRFLYLTRTLFDSITIAGVHFPDMPGGDFMALRLDTAGRGIWGRQKDIRGGGDATLGDPYHAVVTPDTALVLFTQATGYMYWKDSVETDLQGVNDACLVSIGPDNHTRWARPVYTDFSTNQRVVSEGTAVWITGNIYSNSAYAMLDTLKLPVSARKFNAFLAKTKMIRPIEVPPSAVQNIAEEDLRLYPIPVHTALRIEGLEGNCRIRLFDMSGRMVHQAETSKGTTATLLDVAEYVRGTYILEVANDQGLKINRKVILQ